MFFFRSTSIMKLRNTITYLIYFILLAQLCPASDTTVKGIKCYGDDVCQVDPSNYEGFVSSLEGPEYELTCRINSKGDTEYCCADSCKFHLGWFTSYWWCYVSETGSLKWRKCKEGVPYYNKQDDGSYKEYPSSEAEDVFSEDWLGFPLITGEQTE